jgi:glyoxylase-like metal-dependent hydrolase (beta-lactamase superfamily II)
MPKAERSAGRWAAHFRRRAAASDGVSFACSRRYPSEVMPRIFAPLPLCSLFVLAGLGCAPASRSLQNLIAKGAGEAKPQVTFARAEPRIGTYISSVRGFNTSSYWVEGPTGLVVIDTQFLLSSAEELVDWAERSTGKKVVLAIVSHANPDKFNGTAVFKRRGIRVVTSDGVLSVMPEVHEKRLRSFYDRYKPDYPRALALPESIGARDTTVDAAGLRFALKVLKGPGCSESHLVVQFEQHLFVGDLVANDNHSWLELGYVEEWLARLDELEALHPAFVYPGRGPSGEASLLQQQRAYLRYVLAIVRELGPSAEPSEATIRTAKARIIERYPYEYDIFLDFGLPAVFKHLAARSTKQP